MKKKFVAIALLSLALIVDGCKKDESGDVTKTTLNASPKKPGIAQDILDKFNKSGQDEDAKKLSKGLDVSPATANQIIRAQKTYNEFGNLFGDAIWDKNSNSFEKGLVVTFNAKICKQINSDCSDTFIPPLSTYYYFQHEKVGTDDWVKVGTYRFNGDIVGWMNTSNLLYWPTRTMYIFNKESGDVQAHFFATKEQLIANLNGENASVLLSNKYEKEGEAYMGFPIVQAMEIETKQGTSEIAQVILVGKLKKETTEYAQKPATETDDYEVSKLNEAQVIEEARIGIGKIDVVFVIDTTLSMGPYIEEVKKYIGTITNSLNGKGHDIRFALVSYRDYHPDLNNKDGKPYQVFPLSDSKSFLNAISEVKQASISTDQRQEAVLEGLLGAISGIGWRDQYGEKVIILIGDSSGWKKGEVGKHHAYQFDENDVIQEAEKIDHLKIFSLRASNVSEIDRPVHYAQFTYLSKETGGESYELENAKQLIDKLKIIIQQREKEYSAKVGVITTITQGKTTVEEANKERKTILLDGKINEEMRKILLAQTEVLDQIEENTHTLRSMNGGGYNAGYGWVCVNPKGSFIAHKEMYITAASLELLITNVNDTIAVLEQGTAEKSRQFINELRNVVHSSTTEGVVPRIWALEEEDPVLSIWFKQNGIPLSKDSILKITKEDILKMDVNDRNVLAEKLKLARASLATDSVTSGRFRGDKIPGKVRIPWGL